MPKVTKKLISIKDKRSTQDIVKAIQKVLQRYSSKYGSMYVGIAADPKKRLAQHNRALKVGSGNKQTDEPWPTCHVIFETGSYDRVRLIEHKIVAWAMRQQGIAQKLWNERSGGGGRRPKDGSKGYVYVLLDPAETKWIEA